MDNTALGSKLSSFPKFCDDLAGGAREFLREPYEGWHSEKHPLASPKTVSWINGHVPGGCPHCGSGSFGSTDLGMARYRRKSCGKVFTPITGTIFDSFKIPPTEWMEHLMHLFEFNSIATGSRDSRNSSSTGRYWLCKIFAALDGWQDSIALGPHTAIDEMSIGARGAEAARDGNGLLPRGSSRNRIVIAVGASLWDIGCFAIEACRGRIIEDICRRIYGEHMMPGTFVTRGGDRSQAAAIREIGRGGAAFSPEEAKGLRNRENPLDQIDDVISSIGSFLSSHPGYSRARTEDWLNPFVFIWNKPFSRLDKIGSFHGSRPPKEDTHDISRHHREETPYLSAGKPAFIAFGINGVQLLT